MRVEGNAEDIAKLLALFEIEDPDNSPNEPTNDEGSGKSYYFDFNKVIPMPESLNVESGSKSSWGSEIFTFPDRLIGSENDWVARRAKGLSTLLLSQGVTTYQDLSNLVLSENPPDWWFCAEESARLDLTAIVRCGHVCMDNIKRYGHDTWYSWSIAHWGTKWNSYHNSISDVEPSSFTFEYQTAWSPPTPVLTKLFEMFPRLSFTIDYIDEGWLYAGTMTSENGELVDHDVPSSEMNSFVYEKFGWEFDEDEDEDEDEDAKTTVSQNLPTSTAAKH